MLIEKTGPLSLKKTKVEDGTVYVQTMEEVEKVFELNRKLREAEAIRRGDPAPFQPSGVEHAYVLQVPERQWSRWIRNNPDRYQRLTKGSQSERMGEAARLQREHPGWFVQAPRKQFRGI